MIRGPLAVTAIIGIAGLLGWGVLMVLRIAAGDVALMTAREHALDWYQVANRSLPRMVEIAEGAVATPAEMQEVSYLTGFGAIKRAQLFDRQGRQVLSSHPASRPGPAQVALARMVQSNGVTKIARGEIGAGKAGYQVYLPIYSEARKIVGTIAVAVDGTATTLAVDEALSTLIVALPVLAALIFAVPAMAALRLSSSWRRHSVQAVQPGVDSLTGVLDRRTVLAFGADLFADRPPGDGTIGIFFIDVDNFKAINDQHGHSFGDRYLTHIAQAIRGCTRGDDLVGRIGGDEFAVILPNAKRPQMRAVASRILATAQRSFRFGGSATGGGVSIGCHISQRGEAMDAALRAADEAVYHAKNLGRGQAVEYYGALARARERRELVEASLTLATRNGEFGIEYQPILSAADERVFGYKAILKVATPEGVPIDPDEFLPIAENTALIRPLRHEMIRRACHVAKDWPNDVHLEVALSPAHFVNETLPGDLERILKRTGFAAQRLILAISERVTVEGGETVAEQLAQLRAMGMSIALDNFGIGRTGFGDMWRNPFDRLNVDPILAENYEYDPDRFGPLIRAVVDLGHRLDMQVTLEGVDRDAHITLVRDVGCDAFEGALAGGALSAEETVEKLAEPIMARERPATS